jgi:hypothetical protein
MELIKRDLKFLRYLENGAVPLRPFFQTMGQSAVYRADRKLRAAGLVFQDGKKRGLTPKGRAVLAQAEQATVAATSLAKYIPHIALAPTVLQRAILTLIAAAIPLRMYKVMPSHQPCFILVGPKMTWKSWIAKLACWMVGIDPREFVLNLGAETCGSLLPRRGARGQVVSERLAISQPVIGLDELGRASRDTTRGVKVLLYGDLEIPFENETFKIDAVPILTLNPKSKKKAATLVEITGLDEGTIRRSVICDLSLLEIPAEVLTEGDALLDRARDLGPAEFPAPQHPEWCPTAEVQEIFLRVLDSPERLAEIDITMVGYICTGLTSWLPPEEALRVGVENYLEVVSTLGWLKPGWRQDLAAICAASAPTAAEDAPEAKADPVVNPLDHTAKVDGMLDSCRRLGIPPERGAALMAKIEELGLEQTDEILELHASLKRAGISVWECAGVLQAGMELADAAGVRGSRASQLVLGLIRTVLNSLPKDARPGQLRKSIAAIGVERGEEGDLRHRIVEARRELAGLRERCDRDREAATEAREERDRLEDERRSLSTHVRRLEGKSARLENRCQARRRDNRLGEDVLQFLARTLPLDGPFAYELCSYLAFRAGGQWPHPTAPVSTESVKEIYDLFLSVVNPALVPEWNVFQIRREAYREGVQAAQAEVGERLAEAHASGRADASVIRNLDDLAAAFRLLAYREPSASSGV